MQKNERAMKDGAIQCRTRTIKGNEGQCRKAKGNEGRSGTVQGNEGQCRKVKVNAGWSRIMQDKDS